jgi:PAS domain S-box-containing protein
MTRLRSISVRQYLLGLVLLAIMPALGIIVYSTWERHYEGTRQTEINLSNLVDSLAMHHESLAGSTRQFLATLGKIPSVQELDANTSSKIFSDLLKQNPQYVNILAARLDGSVYAQSIFKPGINVADRKYFKDVLATKRFSVGEFVISRSVQKPTLNYASPVFSPKGEFNSVVLVGLDLSFYDKLMAQTRLPHDSTITLLDHNGLVLHMAPETTDKPPGTPDHLFKKMESSGSSGIFRTKDKDGSQLHVWRKLKLSENSRPYLYIRISVNEDRLAHASRLTAIRDISMLFAAAILALAITLIIGSIGIVTPTQNLANAARKISGGDLAARVLPGRHLPEELSVLVNGFNEMARALNERDERFRLMLQELRDSEEKYRIVADYTIDWEYWLAPDGRVLYMAPSALTHTGYSKEEFYQNPDLISQILHPDDKTFMAEHIHKHGDRNEPLPQEIRIITRSGEIRHFAHVCQPVYDKDGRLLGRRAGNTDITSRKLAERELLKKSEELLLLNKTLEDRVDEELHKNRQKDHMMMIQSRQAAMGEMISNISHQWRQPLNNLALIIQGMKLDYDLGELTKVQMDQSVKGGMDLIQYMSNTIDDFRNFFKPNKLKSRFSLKEMTQKALGFVSANLDAAGIKTKVNIKSDPVINGYPNEFAQVMINLLNNAKDAIVEKKPADPTIDLVIDKIDNTAVVKVCDNGGGIADGMHDRIFDPYFSTKEQGKGTGIGLYMAKAIIEKNMGGSLTATNADAGACFIIKLPINAGVEQTAEQTSELE